MQIFNQLACRWRSALALGFSLLAVCLVGNVGTRTALADTTLEPPGWDADAAIREAIDINPDPSVVEVNLDARLAKVEYSPGHEVEAWTYDGGLPGPLIRAHVGDRLIVHLTNHLPRPTTIHWHGVRVPFDMDGVPDVSQPPVAPDGSFTYDFTLPDAGLFWYHPHVMSAAQVGFGLYGALLVEDSRDPIEIEDQLVLVLSDIAIQNDGTLDSPESSGALGMAFGREGNHVLVNGRERSTLTVRAGVPQRWRIVNAAKSRYFELHLAAQLTDEPQPFVKVGDDGGLQEYPVTSDTLVVPPGERADVIVTPHAPAGTALVLRSLLFNRGYGSIEYRDIEDLLTMRIANTPPYSGPPLAIPKALRQIPALNSIGATAVSVNLTFAQNSDGSSEYGINGVPFAQDHPFAARPGETQIWTITNTTKWSHPMHLHGFFFQVVDERGEPVHPLAWKDTVDVPFEETRRVLVRFDDRPGPWMFHCHILDHTDGGMMGMVNVGDPGQSMPAHQHVTGDFRH